MPVESKGFRYDLWVEWWLCRALIVLNSLHTFVVRKKMSTLFRSMVAMEMKDQDVSHRGMVTSGRGRPRSAIPDTITQQRDKGNGAMVIWKSCREREREREREGTWGDKLGEAVREWHNKVGSQLVEKKSYKTGRAQSKAQANCCQFVLQAVFLVCALSALCSGINQSMTAISNPAAWLLATAEFHDSACLQIRCYDWVTANEMRPLPGVQ